MTFDLFRERRLLLAGSRLGGFWIAAGVVALVLLLVLYREERRLISRREGLVLLGLRLAAAAVLVLALFEPIAARTFREVVKGRVIVALDVSESMATADPGRSAEERTRLAGTLQLSLSPGEDASAIETMTRREVARRLLDAEDAPIARITREHAVDAFTFARETSPATLAGLADALKRPARHDDPAALTTDWQPALAEALKGSRPADAPVLSVVLLTDGRQNGPNDPLPTVDRLAARGIPVYPVLIGSTRPPRDAAVAAVRASESVYKGDVATIAATLKLDGFEGRAVAVTLDRPGASPLRQFVDAPADGSRPVVTFRVPMDEAGTFPLSVAIDPLEGDLRPDNDRRSVLVQVVDDKARVLLVDGEARWEFRYLHNALARDPRVALEAVVFHQPQNENMTALTYPTVLPARPEDASSDEPDPLGDFDAVIVGDVDPADVTPEAWTRIEAYVAERGGTLVLAAGPRHWADLSGDATARKLLPVLDPRPVAVAPDAVDPAHPSLPPGVPVRPAIAAGSDPGAWPMLQLGSEPDLSRQIWSGLPRLPWVLGGKVKPGATVLATAEVDTNAGADTDAIIAAQPYGLGKVLWVGTGDTWRWRLGVGDAYHHRFWGQVVRWSSSGRLTAGNALVRFGPVRPRVAEGEGARLQARFSEGIAGMGVSAGPDLLIAARVYKADPKTGQATGEAVAVVPLRAAAGQPRTFDGVAPPLPLGSYAIRLDVPQLAEALHLDDDSRQGQSQNQAALDVVARDTSERVELAAARDPLDRLAAATGGRVLADFEADQLPPLLHARTRVTSRSVETPLWDQPVSLLLFFSILTAEWIMRKRVGLP